MRTHDLAVKPIGQRPVITGFVRMLGCMLAAIAIPAAAAERVVRITAPESAVPGSVVPISVSASTDFGQGEQVGFFHGQYSNDGGETWTDFSADVDAGRSVKREVRVPAGSGNSPLLIRVRVAFRGGVAGDVDLKGAAIRWEDTWSDWKVPPAQVATVRVTAR